LIAVASLHHQTKQKQITQTTNKMKKIVIIAAVLISLNTAANAQSANSSASQTVNLNLANAIDISFTGTGTATGSAVNFPFNTVNDYANGVESTSQELKVRSNKKFNVTVKANSSTFSYSGSASPAPTMTVWNTLSCMVTANTTGGSVSLPYTTNSYYSITSVAQNMISNGIAGGDQKFSVKYKADPGFSYPAGTYTVDVVYTATQL